MPKINIENAQIKTAAVEIKTLTVSGKQVTLSVFRQIQEEKLLDYNSMKLNGIPWGIVNYYWGNNDESDGYHILWQKGSELRRAFINRTTHPWKVHLDESIKYGEMDRQLALRKIQEILGDIIRYEERIKIELKNIEFLKNKLSALAIDLKHYQEKEDYLKKQIKDDEKQRLENIPKLQKIIDSIKDLPHLFIAV